MRYSHMDPAEADQFFRDLGPAWMIPCHWGARDWAEEPYAEPPSELRRVIQAAGNA